MKRYMQFRTEPRKLPVVFSIEEVSDILMAAPGSGLKYPASISISYGGGSGPPGFAPSKSAISTAIGCWSLSNWERVGRSCCRQDCWSCCARGGVRRGLRAGSFRASPRSSRSKRTCGSERTTAWRRRPKMKLCVPHVVLAGRSGNAGLDTIREVGSRPGCIASRPSGNASA